MGLAILTFQRQDEALSSCLSSCVLQAPCFKIFFSPDHSSYKCHRSTSSLDSKWKLSTHETAIETKRFKQSFCSIPFVNPSASVYSFEKGQTSLAKLQINSFFHFCGFLSCSRWRAAKQIQRAGALRQPLQQHFDLIPCPAST